MEPILSSGAAYVLVALYVIVMLAVVFFFTPKDESREDFLVSGRQLSVWRGASSMAVSWVWAPAIFFCALMAFTKGLPGLVWFTVPNIICFFTFAAVAVRMRRQNTTAMSMPDYIRERFNNHRTSHIASMICVLLYDACALMLNTVVGSFLLFLMAGIPVPTGMIIMLGVAVLYSAWRGLPASVATDVVQYAAIIIIAFVIVPWVISASGGWETVGKGLGGVSGNFGDLFNYEVFYTFGIVTTFVLIIGPLSDQMFYQRAMACPPENIVKTFVIAGLLFALVPVTLGLLGFVAAVSPVSETVQQEGFPTILNNVAAVREYLPEWAVIGFIVMAICALSSTLDSALCAIGSIWGQDIYARYINPDADEAKSMMSNRVAVVVVGIVAMVVAILLRDDMNAPLIFNMTGIVASPIVPPMILAVFWPRTTAQAISAATIVALLIGVPYGWWANHLFYVQGDQAAYDHVLAAQLITPAISLVIAWVLTQMSASAPEQAAAE